MKFLMMAGRLAFSAIFKPSVTWLMIIWALSTKVILSWGLMPDWFSVK